MKARGYGRIVNVSSVAGKEGNPRASAYSASKAAVIGFTKSLGKELVKDGVNVNAVAPAVIETADARESRRRTRRLYALQDSNGTVRDGGGSGRSDLLARKPRMLVQHERGVRRLRRPRYLLMRFHCAPACRVAESGRRSGCRFLDQSAALAVGDETSGHASTIA
jgi:NAD(P)-dependent dehydrogenase (short-subunit alcohol dehydrogenase family)